MFLVVKKITFSEPWGTPHDTEKTTFSPPEIPWLCRKTEKNGNPENPLFDRFHRFSLKIEKMIKIDQKSVKKRVKVPFVDGFLTSKRVKMSFRGQKVRKNTLSHVRAVGINL